MRRPTRPAVPAPKPPTGLAPEPTHPPASHAPAATPPRPHPEGDDPRASALLASLRHADPRLLLSQREVSQLAPTVTEWLARGVGPAQITEQLTTGLPDHFRARPARILAYRLHEPPVAAPPAPPPPAKPAVLPWQTCDGCERAFRAPAPRRCRDCPPADDDAPTASGSPRIPYVVSADAVGDRW